MELSTLTGAAEVIGAVVLVLVLVVRQVKTGVRDAWREEAEAQSAKSTRLAEEVQSLAVEVRALRIENVGLCTEVKAQREEITALRGENAGLRNEVGELRNENRELRDHIDILLKKESDQ